MGCRPNWMRKAGIPVALLSFVTIFVAGIWVTMTAQVNNPKIGLFYIGMSLLGGAFIGHIVGWLFIGYPGWFHMSNTQIEIMDEYSPRKNKKRKRG
ncbi:MAG: hypothetical protein WCK89_21165 [bacterium]